MKQSTRARLPSRSLRLRDPRAFAQRTLHGFIVRFVDQDPELERHRVAVAEFCNLANSQLRIAPRATQALAHATRNYIAALERAGAILGRPANDLLRGARLAPLPSRLRVRLVSAEGAWYHALRALPLPPVPRALAQLRACAALFGGKATVTFGAIPADAPSPDRRRRRMARRPGKRVALGDAIIRRDVGWYFRWAVARDSITVLARRDSTSHQQIRFGLRRAERLLEPALVR